jgi:hypothetical protein
MSRKAAAIASMLLMLAVVAATATAGLTDKNSAVFPFQTTGPIDFKGVNCGGTASFTESVPEGSVGIKVIKPKVGDRGASGDTVVASVAVDGVAITITVLADGPAICDPEQSGYLPGDTINWSSRFDLQAQYTRRVQVPMRINFAPGTSTGTKWKQRPKWISDEAAGAPRAVRTRITGISWSQFGGLKAVGHGKWRLDYCRDKSKCSQDGMRLKLVAGDAGKCSDSGRIEYRELKTYSKGKFFFALKLHCGS